MAKTALKVKQARKPKFGVRAYTRCQKCGRPKAVYRKFGLCRICLRDLAASDRGPTGSGRRHQEDLVMPGSSPLCAMSRKQIRHRPNLR